MRPRIVLAVLAASASSCSTTLMIVDAGSDDAGSDASADSPPPFESGSPDVKDAGILIADCGMADLEASVCVRPTPCTADPTPDASACLDEMNASCGVLYRLAVECQRKYTICNPSTCKTDPVKTGTSIQQNCMSQTSAYEACKGMGGG